MNAPTLGRVRALLAACDGTDGEVERLDVEQFLTELGFTPQDLPSGSTHWSRPDVAEQFFTDSRYLIVPPGVARNMHARLCNLLKREGYQL